MFVNIFKGFLIIFQGAGAVKLFGYRVINVVGPSDMYTNGLHRFQLPDYLLNIRPGAVPEAEIIKELFADILKIFFRLEIARQVNVPPETDKVRSVGRRPFIQKNNVLAV